MSDHFSQPRQRPLLWRTLSSSLQPSLGKGIGVLIVLAFGSGAVLLANDVPWLPVTPLAHAPISAVPLLLIGLAALGFQFVIRPNLLDLFKAMIVSTAFLLWGTDQLLPAGWLATAVGDLVIVLYVIDLGWMMADRLREPSPPNPASQDMATPSPLEPDPLDGPTQPLHILPLPSCPSLRKLPDTWSNHHHGFSFLDRRGIPPLRSKGTVCSLCRKSPRSISHQHSMVFPG
jgi:hypothetical protein